MTEQEAINLLDNLVGMVEDNHNSDYDMALKMGIKAIEKQIPKKVVFDGNEWTCPRCNTPVLDINIMWCDICGQKLRWGEEE